MHIRSILLHDIAETKVRKDTPKEPTIPTPTPVAVAAMVSINSNNRNGTVARLRIRREWRRWQGCWTSIQLLPLVLLSLNILLVNGEIVSTKSSNTTAMMDMIKDRLIQSNLLLHNGTEFEPILLTTSPNNNATSSSAADTTAANTTTPTANTTASTNATTTTTTTTTNSTPADTVYYSTPSYQYDALQRTSQVVGVEFMSLSKVIQYYALYCIYEATSAKENYLTQQDPRFLALTEFPPWLFQTGWTDPNVDPCGGSSGSGFGSTNNTSFNKVETSGDGFYGITCDDDGRVTELDLSDNLLTGAWPPEVVYLGSNLRVIDLYKNEFLTNYQNDTSWLSDMGPTFQTFMVQGTAFGGHIPKLPSSIVNFNIADTLYDGGLTDENFQDATSLAYIDMDNNNFSNGTATGIPNVVGQLPNLQYFYCNDCFLNGNWSFLEGVTSPIVELWIDANVNITGTIPADVGNLTTLESLSIAYNSLTGYMPTTFDGLTNLKQFWAYGNLLSGEIPTTLGELTKLSIVQLEGNSFVGSMPELVCQNTVFPTDFLKQLGADCDDILFVCPCCTCCDIESCLLQNNDDGPATSTTAARPGSTGRQLREKRNTSLRGGRRNERVGVGHQWSSNNRTVSR